MNTCLRIILSSMACLAGATTLSRRSSDMSDTESPPIEAFSSLESVHELYLDAAKSIKREILLKAGKFIGGQLAKGFLQDDKIWELKINESEWVEYFHDSSIRWERAASLAAFVELCQPQHMLEIGSFLGLSTNFYLRLMEPWGGHLTSVDPNIRHRVFDEPREIFNKVNSKFSDRLHTVDGFWMKKSTPYHYEHYPPFWDKDTIQAIFDARKVVTPKDVIEDGKLFDMAFIDRAEDYESVQSDFSQVLDVLKPSSCIIFDDFDKEAKPDSYKAIIEIFQEASESEEGLMVFGDKTALFIDRGFIESRQKAAGHVVESFL